MNDSPIYTFDWRLKEHAHVISLLVRERYRSGVWRALRWTVVIILGVATVATVASALLRDFASAFRLGPLVILVGGLTFWFEKWTGWIRAWQIRRLDPGVHHPISFEIEDSSLRVITKVADTRLGWGGLHKVRETPDLFMFYYSERIAYYLPKRVVGGEAEVGALRALILERLSTEVPFQGEE